MVAAMAATSSTTLPLGATAPAFSLTDPQGGTHDLDSLAGDAAALLVAFLCNHCPYVKHIRPAFAARATEWQARGVAVIAINSNDADAYPEDSPDAMAAASAEFGFTFPYVIDESQDVATAYGAACTPDLFLFDGDRRLVYHGQFDASRPNSGTPATGADLAAAIDALLAGAPVPADQRPSVGCSIKWKPGNEPGSR
jgi:peroxiredoxin